MTEHENFKEIIDLIGYESIFKYKPIGFNSWLIVWFHEYDWHEGRVVNLIEIIFTPKFMDKYDYYRYNNDIYPIEANEILDNLDDPVSYLYNTLWLWSQHKL